MIIGNQNRIDLVGNDLYFARLFDNMYIDKTGFIEAVVMSPHKAISLVWPKGSGKSYSLKTLNYYMQEIVYGSDESLFEDTFIGGRGPVEETLQLHKGLTRCLYLSGSQLVTLNKQTLLDSFRNIIVNWLIDMDFHEDHIKKDMIEYRDIDVAILLQALTKFHERCEGRVMVLIDDYDQELCHSVSESERADMQYILQKFLDILIKGAPGVFKVVIAGSKDVTKGDAMVYTPEYPGVFGDYLSLSNVEVNGIEPTWRPDMGDEGVILLPQKEGKANRYNIHLVLKYVASMKGF